MVSVIFAHPQHPQHPSARSFNLLLNAIVMASHSADLLLYTELVSCHGIWCRIPDIQDSWGHAAMHLLGLSAQDKWILISYAHAECETSNNRSCLKIPKWFCHKIEYPKTQSFFIMISRCNGYLGVSPPLTKPTFLPWLVDPISSKQPFPSSPCSSAHAGGGWLTSECLAPGSPRSCLKGSTAAWFWGENQGKNHASTGKPMDFANQNIVINYRAFMQMFPSTKFKLIDSWA